MDAYPSMTIAMHPRLGDIYKIKCMAEDEDSLYCELINLVQSNQEEGKRNQAIKNRLQNWASDSDAMKLASKLSSLQVSKQINSRHIVEARVGIKEHCDGLLDYLHREKVLLQILLDNHQVATTANAIFPAMFKIEKAWILKYISIMKELVNGLEAIENFGDGVDAFNPLKFSSAGHDAYLSYMSAFSPRLLFVTSNPGPDDYAGGIPFGSKGALEKGPHIHVDCDHPFRFNENPDSANGDIENAEFWRWITSFNINPRNPRGQCFVLNYCPLLFLKNAGNGEVYQRTKVDLSSLKNQRRVIDLCNEGLKKVIELLEPSDIVAIGDFVHDRIKEVQSKCQCRRFDLHKIFHPADPKNINKEWGFTVTEPFKTWMVGHW